MGVDYWGDDEEIISKNMIMEVEDDETANCQASQLDSWSFVLGLFGLVFCGGSGWVISILGWLLANLELWVVVISFVVCSLAPLLWCLTLTVPLIIGNNLCNLFSTINKFLFLLFKKISFLTRFKVSVMRFELTASIMFRYHFMCWPWIAAILIIWEQMNSLSKFCVIR